MAEDSQGQTHVKGLSIPVATSEEDALHYLFEGETNRSVGAHTLNMQSSRSHCVFTIHLSKRSRVESEERIIKSKLHFVDLAVGGGGWCLMYRVSWFIEYDQLSSIV